MADAGGGRVAEWAEVLPVLTVGHGTADEDELRALLQGAGVVSLVDIRTAPGSRRLPHVHRDALARWLPAAGIAYRWERRLGGFRKLEADSPDVWWTNASFRGYAGYARTPEFAAALDDVLAEAARLAAADAGELAVLCSETVWWRCHRRIVADVAVLCRGVAVSHLMHTGQLVRHVPSAGARLVDGLLVYDAGMLPAAGAKTAGAPPDAGESSNRARKQSVT